MRKIIILLVFALSIPFVLGKDWYSGYDKNKIIEDNSAFWKSPKIEHSTLRNALNKYDESIRGGDVVSIYNMRPQIFRDTVPWAIFESKICNPANLPSEVYHTLSDIIIDDQKALIKTYYVNDGVKFQTCDQSVDVWEYNKNNQKWEFLSNSLSWGSSIVLK